MRGVSDKLHSSTLAMDRELHDSYYISADAEPKHDLSGIQVVCRSSSKPKSPDTSCWRIGYSPHANQYMHCDIHLSSTQDCAGSTDPWQAHSRSSNLRQTYPWPVLVHHQCCLFTCSSFLLKNKGLLGQHPCSLVLHLRLSSGCLKNLKLWKKNLQRSDF